MVKFTFPAFFFNRTKEIKQITATLTSPKPQFTVMLGPPSSGKTALMRHIIKQTDHNGPLFHPIRIDLRSVDISAKDVLYSSILKQVSDPRWWDFFKNLKSVEVKATEDFSMKANFFEKTPLNLVELLDLLKSAFRPFNAEHGTRPVVLLVDEANKFKFMENEMDLRTFLDFAVEVSKQESKCHVVFTSSDSFFEDWLEKRIYFIMN